MNTAPNLAETAPCHYCGGPTPPNSGGGEIHERGAALGSSPTGLLCGACFNATRAAIYTSEGNLTTGLYHHACTEEALSQSRNQPERLKPWLRALLASLRPAMAAVVEWEREVWFGGKYPDRDDAYTETDRFGDRVYRTTNDRVPLRMYPKSSLQRLFAKATHGSQKCVLDDTTYRVHASCCRVLFQIEREKTVVVIRLTEDQPRATACLYGVEGKAENIEPLLRKAIGDWKLGAMTFEASYTTRVA